jgi:hypothetical protein
MSRIIVLLLAWLAFAAHAADTPIASSDFTGTDDTTPPGFIDTNGGETANIVLDGGRYVVPYVGDFADGVWNGEGAGSFTADQYAQAEITGISNPGGLNAAGVTLRCSTDTYGARDCYRIYVYEENTTQILVDRVVNDVVTNIATISAGSFSNGDLLRAEIVGTSIRVYINSTQVHSGITDSSLSSGRPGITGKQGYGPNLYGDNWEAGNFTEDADDTPDPFSFVDQTNAPLSSTITSAAVEITGIDTEITCTATGGTIDLNGDDNFQSSQDVNEGDEIRARHTSSGSNSTATNTLVDCNGVSDTFTSTTESASSGGSALSIIIQQH